MRCDGDIKRSPFKLKVLLSAHLMVLVGLAVGWIWTHSHPVDVTFIRRHSDRSDRLSGINYGMAWHGAAIQVMSSHWQMQFETDGKPGPVDLARGKPSRSSWYFDTNIAPEALPHIARLPRETPTSIWFKLGFDGGTYRSGSAGSSDFDGVQYWRSSTSQNRLLKFPTWCLLVPSVLFASVRLSLSRLRSRSRRRLGRCVNCGYDLRATPGRCPECGATPKQLGTAG